MAKNKISEDSKSTKIVDHIEEIASDEEEIETVELPKQEAFFKMPKKFGTVPDVSEKPLGWGKGGYAHLYPHIKLPSQRLETTSFDSKGEANKLYWGDNLHIMRTLSPESIDLIYIDPPFFSGKNYNMIFQDQNEVMTFEDIWDGGLPTYQIWLNARLVEMKRLLKKTGSIYIHLDWHASHYVKVELDKIFGYENFRNEIVWSYTGASSPNQRQFPRKHDIIFWYSKGDKWTFNGDQIRIPYSKSTMLRIKAGERGGKSSESVFHGKRTEREAHPEGKIIEDWWDIPIVGSTAKERLGYPTQKPEALLERIIKASTKEGEVVADFFCGGGTTPAVAQRLGRRWMASDISRIAIEVTKGRILRQLKSEKGTQKSFDRVPDMKYGLGVSMMWRNCKK